MYEHKGVARASRYSGAPPLAGPPHFHEKREALTLHPKKQKRPIFRPVSPKGKRQRNGGRGE
jgi:hypothetical protein